MVGVAGVFLLLTNHCSGIPSYQSDDQPDVSPPIVDSAPLPDVDVPRDSGSDARAENDSSCSTPFVDPTAPSADDGCRYATPLAWSEGSLRFGELGAQHFAVTPSWIYLIVRRQLWRLPRSLWLNAGAASFETCQQTVMEELEPSAVQALFPWDNDGVCLYDVRGQARCAAAGETSMHVVPGIEGTADAGGLPLGINSSSIYLVWGRPVDGGTDVFRYAAGFAAPERLGHTLRNDRMGPFLDSNDAVRFSRFCGGCGADVCTVDPRTIPSSLEGKCGPIPWPGAPTGVARGMVAYGTTLLVHHSEGQRPVRRSSPTGVIDLFTEVDRFVGPRTDPLSFALTRALHADAGAANFELLAPATNDSLAGIDGPDDLRRTEISLSDKYQMVIEGEDLFVASMPRSGCANAQGWIAKVPRNLR